MVEDKDSPPLPEIEPETLSRQTRRQTVNHSNGTSSNGGQPAPSTSNGSWECSVCTYQNIEDEFKCAMCETRKGTSTRKPRATSQTQTVQIQVLAAELVAKQTNALLRKQRRRQLRQLRNISGQSVGGFNRPGRLKNVDRSKGTKINVTVNNVTVVITDYPEMKTDTTTPTTTATTTPTTPTTTTPTPAATTTPTPAATP